MRFFLATALLFAAVTLRANTYYVSPTGNDANAGTSQGAAWQTIGAVDNFAFSPGDTILFQGGATFSGSIYFDAADSGNNASGALISPISVGSYGTGRATINAGTSFGLFAYDNGGFTLSNLNFTGSGASNTEDGLSFFNDLAGGVKQQHIYLDNIDVSGFGKNGIVIGGGNGASGYNDVRVTNVSTHNNGRDGLGFYGPAFNAASPSYANSSVYISHVSAFNNSGVAGASDPTGSGIVLGSVSNGTVERSITHHNGANNTSATGPVGIWAYDSTDITIQHNESYANKTNYNAGSGTGGDGDGFDLDQNVSNSVLQYNYSHDNDSAGFLLYSGKSNAAHNGNVVRYNVSENDARKNNYGSITAGGAISADEIYNNTVFLSASASGTSSTVRVLDGSTSLHFRNNIFDASGAMLVNEQGSASDLQFQRNDYWSTNGAFNVSWSGTNYASLASWSGATDEEKIGGSFVGLSVDPKLANPGSGGTIGNADQLESLSAYRLQSTSPLLDAGTNLNVQFGINAGSADFYGENIPQGNGYAIGASEVPEPSLHVWAGIALIFAAVVTLRGILRRALSTRTRAAGDDSVA